VSIDQIQDIEVLRNLVKMQLRESERLKAQLAEAHAKLKDKNIGQAEQLALELANIERQHAAALKKLFGQKSERRPKNGEKQARAAQKGHGRKAQPELPIVEEKHTLPESSRVCELCQSVMKEWPGEFEDSEEIDFIAPQVIIKRHRRQKYRCSCGGCVKTAPGTRKLFAKARYSINLALHVAVQKYCYHMPLSRQVKVFRRQGLEVTTATLWDYLSALYELLEPALERLDQHVLAQPVMGVDETTWKLLKTETKGKSKNWWVWARRVDDAVHYTLAPSRGLDVARKILDGYHGTIIVDGYSTYEAVQRTNRGITLAHCWCHARRDLLPFEEDPRAARMLRVIQRMYRLEATAKAKGLSTPELFRWRQRKARPLLEAFFRWLLTLQIPSTYELHAAVKYIMLRKQSLLRFVDDPLLSPDNNATERVIRGVVVGRKNHYGSRSERGTQVAALFYSLLDSAELAGINPHEYLQIAVNAALEGEQIPLPHEIAADNQADLQSGN
jgi:transposase